MERYECFDCAKLCLEEGGKFSDVKRSSMNCVRADLPPVLALCDSEDQMWMGLPKRAPDDGFDWQYPREPYAEGCPGAWYRSVFIRSLDKYIPRVMGESWFKSLHLREDTPRLVLDAVQRYMDHRQACETYVMEERNRVRAKY